MSESLIYEFYVCTRYVGSEVKVRIDLIEEEVVNSMEEWEEFDADHQAEVLESILDDFVNNEVESGWSKVD